MDKVLEFFIKEPEKEFHIRRISKILKKSPTTISKYLRNFEKQGILKSKRKLNHFLFKANLENEKFKILKLNYNLERLYESKLIDYLVEEFNYPEAIILFGSFSKAENTQKSDIDILVISPLKKDVELNKFEKKLNSEVQLFVYSKKTLKKINKELLNKFVNGIVIYGFWEAF